MIKSNPIYKVFVVIVGCVLLLALSSFSPVFGSTPTNQVILTRQEYNVLQQKLITLDNTIDEQLRIIDELEQQLNVAKMSTTESKEQLLESMNLIKEQRAQLIEAKNSLEQQERTLTMQSESLAKVNAYLEMQTRELQKVKMQQRNSKLLNILLGGAVVYLAAKN